MVRPPMSPTAPRLAPSTTSPSKLSMPPAAQSAKASRRSAASSLRLPNLPRYHPANYPGTLSTSTNTPQSPPALSTTPSSAASARPPPHSRQLSDAQRALYAHQRELYSSGVAHHARVSASPVRSPPPSGGLRSPRPKSPHLSPLGSPGPVTPLELGADSEEGYLVRGGKREDRGAIVDALIAQELAGLRIRGQGVEESGAGAQEERRPSAPRPIPRRPAGERGHRSNLSR